MKEINHILSNPSLEAQRTFLSEYRFQLKDIPVLISVRLYNHPGSGLVEFRQSHFIKTPVQAGKYRTDSTWGENEAEALRLAVQTLVSFYDEAVAAGHEPQNDWLVENKYF